ncbi:hypothetical protein GGX14DRAFT_572796 [Mycena pura]|uniref:Uncharacterized protein n=1 Tax=Mycena pura TaxID=153505 RepID=A0AAD6V332_9AGAR|nr:hypothetical protein GGX14DRAFT_572796 [Mycena pura]
MSQREKLWDEWREERVPHLCMLPAPSACRPRPAAPLPFSRRPCPVPAPGSLHAAPAVCTLPVPSTRHGLLRPLALPLGPRPRPLQANPALHRLHTHAQVCGLFLDTRRRCCPATPRATRRPERGFYELHAVLLFDTPRHPPRAPPCYQAASVPNGVATAGNRTDFPHDDKPASDA